MDAWAMPTPGLSPPRWWLAAGLVAAVVDACVLFVLLRHGIAG